MCFLVGYFFISHNAQAGLVIRFADMQSEGGEYGGDLQQSDGSTISAPSAQLDNVGSYELSFIAPSRAPYHIYLRYKSLSADDYQTSGTFNAQQILTTLEKNTFDVGVFIPYTFSNYYNEAIFALRYDDVEHSISSVVSSASAGRNQANYEQGLWGVHAANKIYFPLSEKWQFSTSIGGNLLFGERDSQYAGDLNGNINDSEFVAKVGVDAEVALIFEPNKRFNIKGGYGYSMMFNYLAQDLYADQSLHTAGLTAENSGDANYSEYGPFIELMLGF